MYFETSLQKTLPLMGAAVAIALGITLFLSVNAAWDATDKIADFTAREIAEMSYRFQFDWLHEAPAAVATVATSTPGEALSIPILLYHGEGPAATMPTAVFVQQLRTLKAAGWQTITIEQFESFMKDGAPLPAKSFLLTFDDGRKDTFYSVDPVLQELHYTAVMFVITGFSLPADGKESDYYLNKSELQYMADSGRWELESHGDEDHRLYSVPATTSSTATSSVSNAHFLSNKFWLANAGGIETTAQYTARITNDLQTSKTILETDFGKPVIGFAYPFNDSGENSINFNQSQQLLAQIVPSIYTFAFEQADPLKSDAFNYPNPSTYFIKRIEPAATWSGQYLLSLLEQGQGKDLPYESGQFGSDWSSTWGTSTSTSDGLSLHATPATTGAIALLSGSQSWSNYTVTMDASVQSGNAVSLIARDDQETDHYLACALSSSRILLEEHYADGTQTTLASTPYQSGGAPNARISMSVSGSSATCSAYDTSVSAQAGAAPAAGGIGVEVWNATPGVAQAHIADVSAQAL